MLLWLPGIRPNFSKGCKGVEDTTFLMITHLSLSVVCSSVDLDIVPCFSSFSSIQAKNFFCSEMDIFSKSVSVEQKYCSPVISIFPLFRTTYFIQSFIHISLMKYLMRSADIRFQLIFLGKIFLLVPQRKYYNGNFLMSQQVWYSTKKFVYCLKSINKQNKQISKLFLFVLSNDSNYIL